MRKTIPSLIPLFLLLLPPLFISAVEEDTAIQKFPSFTIAIDEVNPKGTDFPGGRGPDQLVVYTPEFGARTGTNPWGIEAVVKPAAGPLGDLGLPGGRVATVGGNNSEIPPGGFVVSGHGRGARLIRELLSPGLVVFLQTKGKPQLFCLEDGRSRLLRTQALLDKLDSYLKQPALSKAHRAELQQKLSSLHQKLLLLEAPLGSRSAITPELEQLSREARSLLGRVAPEPAHEARGAWWRVEEKNCQQVEQKLAPLAEYNFNLIMPETFFEGGSLFPAPDGYIPQWEQYQGWDPLACIVEQAHQAGLEVHCWNHIFFVGFEQSPLVKKYPRWLAKKRNGQPASQLEPGYQYFCPSNPQAREFLLKNLEYQARHYDIDGLQLDYIRYPLSRAGQDEQYCYCPLCRESFKKLHGKDPLELSPEKTPQLWNGWRLYREQQINSFVEEAHKRLKAIKPALKISAAVFPLLEDARETKFQNWPLWANKGWIDLLCPMIYSLELDYIRTSIRGMRKVLPAQFPIFAGLAPFMGIGGESLLEQVVTTRLEGAPGVVFFALNYMNEAELKNLQDVVFQNKTAVIPPQNQ